MADISQMILCAVQHKHEWVYPNQHHVIWGKHSTWNMLYTSWACLVKVSENISLTLDVHVEKIDIYPHPLSRTQIHMYKKQKIFSKKKRQYLRISGSTMGKNIILGVAYRLIFYKGSFWLGFGMAIYNKFCKHFICDWINNILHFKVYKLADWLNLNNAITRDKFSK